MTSGRTTAAPARGGQRALSYLIDLLVAVALGMATWPLFKSWVIVGIVVVEVAVVQNIARAATGRTIGGLATGTIAYHVGTAHAPGFGPQALRSAIMGVLHLTAIGPLVTVVMTRDGRDWVDRFAETSSASLRHEPVAADWSPAVAAAPSGPVAAPAEEMAYMAPSVVPAEWSPTSSGAQGPGVHAEWPPTSTGGAQASGVPAGWPPASSGAPVPAAQAPSAPGAPLATAGGSYVTPAPPARPAPSRPTSSDPWASIAPPAPAQRVAPAPPSFQPPPAPQRAAEPVAEPPAARRSSEPAPIAAEPTQRRAPIWVTPDTGSRVEMRGVLVFGREPVTSGDPNQTAVPVPDPTRSLSRTHARMGIDGQGVWVEDAYSTNGTFARMPDGRTVELVRGHRLYVPVGSIVLLGDRTLTITHG